MNHKEHELQCNIVKYLKLKGIFCFSVPNGDRRDARTGSRLKKEGVLPGVSDLIIIRNKELLFIEIKTK